MKCQSCSSWALNGMLFFYANRQGIMSMQPPATAGTWRYRATCSLKQPSNRQH
jgi:hypothetical protein